MNLSWARRLCAGFCLAGGWFWGAPVVWAQEVIPLQETSAETPGDKLLLLRAEQISREGEIITCVGKVRVEYEGLQLDCQWLQ